MFGALAAAVVVAPSALARTSASPSCSLISVATMKAVLGIPIVSAQPVKTPGNPGLVLCSYATAANSEAVQLGFQTKTGAASFANNKKQAQQYAKSVPGIGSAAFYNDAGVSSSHGSLDVLKGTTEISIVAFASLSRVEQLGKKVASLL